MTILKLVLKNIVLCALTAYLFFRNAWSLLGLIPYFAYGIYRDVRRGERLRRRELEEQFRDGLQCLLSSLEAGYSMENSILHAEKELARMFHEKAPIVQEFRRMGNKLQSGSSAEELLAEFGRRCEVEDIRNFAGVYGIVKRSGGDVIRIVRSVTDTMYQKQEVLREIRTVLLAKQMEVAVMKAMPYGILAYFLIFSPSFLEPLYANLAGNLLMAVIFVLYLLCCRAAERIADIRV